jgi:hypothetical protein
VPRRCSLVDLRVSVWMFRGKTIIGPAHLTVWGLCWTLLSNGS